LLQKWSGWIKGPIHDQVLTLAFERDVYEEYQGILGRASEEARGGTIFHNWLSGTYVTSVSVAVRRSVDHNKRTVSLMRLMEEIRDHPTAMTRERYLSLFSDQRMRDHIGEREFDKWGSDVADPAVVDKDIGELIEATKDTKHYVDKRVAHHDGRVEEVVSVTWGELNGAIDAIEKAFVRYYGLIAVAGYVIDDITHSPWQHIFEAPWVEPREEMQRMRRLIEEFHDAPGDISSE